MSSSIALALAHAERERLRLVLAGPVEEWDELAQEAVEAGQREWEAGLGLLETAYCGRCGRRVAPLPGDVGEYRCPACRAALWRSTSPGRHDHLHDDPDVGCSPLRCDRLELRLVEGSGPVVGQNGGQPAPEPDEDRDG